MMQLVKQEGFVQSLDYGYYRYINRRQFSEDNISRSTFMCDVIHSDAYVEAMNEIRSQFQTMKQNKDRKNGVVIDESTTLVPLLFSMFYDGIQVFSSLVTDFSPLTITILNLPSNMRNKLGIGKHLSIIELL
jgi:hypothetical protein